MAQRIQVNGLCLLGGAMVVGIFSIGCSKPSGPTAAPAALAVEHRAALSSDAHGVDATPPPPARPDPVSASRGPTVRNPVSPVTADDKAAFDAVGEKAEVGELLDFIGANPLNPYAARARHILEAKPIEHKHSSKYKDRARLFIPLQVSGSQPTRFVDCDPQKVGVRQKFAYQHRRVLLQGKPWSGRCPADVRSTYRFSNPSAHPVLLTVHAYGGSDSSVVGPRSTVSRSVRGRGACKATGTPTVAAGPKGPVLTFKDCQAKVDVDLFVLEKDDVSRTTSILARSTPDIGASFALLSERPLSEAAIGLLDAYLNAHGDVVDGDAPDLLQGVYILSRHRGPRQTLKVVRRDEEYRAWVFTMAKPWARWGNFNPWPQVVVAYEGVSAGSLVRFAPTVATQRTAGHERGDYGGVASRPEQTARPFSVRPEIQDGKLVLLSGGQKWLWVGQVAK